MVAKCGKRTAETTHLGNPKRSDVQGTPTKMKAKLTGQVTSPLKPSVVKKRMVYNPYKDPYQAVCNNHPQTWQAHDKVLANSDDNQNMDAHLSPPSPTTTNLPAEEALHES
jgi:hypothetical protein